MIAILVKSQFIINLRIYFWILFHWCIHLMPDLHWCKNYSLTVSLWWWWGYACVRVYVWCMWICECVCLWTCMEVTGSDLYFVTLCLSPLRKNLPLNLELDWWSTTRSDPPPVTLSSVPGSQTCAWLSLTFYVGLGRFELRHWHSWAVFPASGACSRFWNLQVWGLNLCSLVSDSWKCFLTFRLG